MQMGRDNVYIDENNILTLYAPNSNEKVNVNLNSFDLPEPLLNGI